jgi:hypothetical protein
MRKIFVGYSYFIIKEKSKDGHPWIVNGKRFILDAKKVKELSCNYKFIEFEE